MKTKPTSRRYLRFLLLAVSCAGLLSSGCATLANGRTQRLRVETNPPAARVSVQGTKRQTKGGPLQFETPGEVILSRKEKHVVLRIEKDGYEPEEITLNRTLGAWTPFAAVPWLGFGVLMGRFGGSAAAGVFAGIPLGFSVGIDLLTGSAYRLDPSKVSVTLQPKAESSQPGDTTEQNVEPGPLEPTQRH
jgi:hypothetical protein